MPQRLDNPANRTTLPGEAMEHTVASEALA